MIEMEKLKKRVKIFYDENMPTHIVTKQLDWWNGYIIEVLDDHIIFLDRIRGRVPIIYEDIVEFDFFKGNMSTLKKVGELKENENT